MMVTMPVRFEVPGQWQLVSDVELTSTQSAKLRRIVKVYYTSLPDHQAGVVQCSLPLIILPP